MTFMPGVAHLPVTMFLGSQGCNIEGEAGGSRRVPCQFKKPGKKQNPPGRGVIDLPSRQINDFLDNPK